jgi:hypothetical protein
VGAFLEYYYQAYQALEVLQKAMWCYQLHQVRQVRVRQVQGQVYQGHPPIFYAVGESVFSWIVYYIEYKI